MKTTHIRITVTCGETIEVAYFGNNRIGQSKSVKFLEGLKKEYVSSPYLTKISELKKAINRNWGYKKVSLEGELQRYIIENSSLKPAPLQVSIENIQYEQIPTYIYNFYYTTNANK